MKDLHRSEVPSIGGGVEPHLSDNPVAPDPLAGDPLVVIDYNPPRQPQ